MIFIYNLDPLVWQEYYAWAEENFTNAQHLKQLEHKALNSILSAENSLVKFGENEKVFQMFNAAIDGAKNWNDVFR